MNINVNNLKVGDLLPVPPEPKSELEIMSSWGKEHSGPLVSILCHTYNHVGFLQDALNGFLMQETTFPFEIILHDDASTDGTIEIVNKYSEAYPNIIIPIIQTENQYSKGCKPSEITLPLAKGKYIAFCEGDDYWIDEAKLNKQKIFLENNVNFNLVFTDRLVEIDGKYINALYKHKNYTRKDVLQGFIPPTQTMMFRRNYDLIATMKSYPDNPSGDRMIAYYYSGFSVLGHIQDCTSVYRVTGNGVWSSLSKLNQRKLKYSRLVQFHKKMNINSTEDLSACAESLLLDSLYDIKHLKNISASVSDFFYFLRTIGSKKTVFLIYKKLF